MKPRRVKRIAIQSQRRLVHANSGLTWFQTRSSLVNIIALVSLHLNLKRLVEGGG